MKNRQLLTTCTNSQHGISLVVALIMLLIMTVIGISAMNTSISKLRMTGSIEQQSVASNDTEESLKAGEAEVAALTFDGGIFIDNSDRVTFQEINFQDDNEWITADGLQTYIIEYLGPRTAEGEPISIGSGTPPPGDKRYIYRVTARIDEGGARRMFQSLYINESGPN
jgi:type IV pilus assembly protein PilX